MAQTTYPSPYPAYAETYLTPDGYFQGSIGVSNMAYYGGGPDPLQNWPNVGGQQIHRRENIQVHRYDPTPAYNHMPTTSPPLYQPTAGAMGFGYQDPSMQTFCQAFGEDFSFYNTAPNSGMPQGYYIAMQGLPEAVEARKAIKKEIRSPPALTEGTEAQSKKPHQKRKSIACC